MFCPTCGAQAAEGAAFCATCGAKFDTPTDAPTEPMPEQSAPPGPGPSPLAPVTPPAMPPQMPTQPQPAVAAQAPPAQMPPQQVPPAGLPPQPGSAAAPPPPPSGGGMKIALIIGAIVVVLGLAGAAAAFFLLPKDDEPPTTTTTPSTTATPPTSTTPPSTVSGFATPEEAVQSEIPADWVYEMIADTPDEIEYWAGPPQSEYAEVIIVSRSADGSWEVTDSRALELGQSEVPPSDDELALFTVEDFLYAVMDDRADDAHALTVSPFSEDPASASFGSGDFLSFTIDQVEPTADGGYWVSTSEVWAWGTDHFIYKVIETANGWRISDAALQGG